MVTTTKRKIILMVISLIFLVGITFSFKLVYFIENQTLKIIAQWGIYVLIGLLAILSMFLQKDKIRKHFKTMGTVQYLFGILLALILSLVFGIIPIIFGHSIIGTHVDYDSGQYFYYFMFYMFLVGPMEELYFRVYIQDTIKNILPKYKWISVILSSLLFGFWHLINGSFIQVLFTSIIGFVFGFAKYKFDGCNYKSVACGHGLYDFLNIIYRGKIL